MASKNFKKFAKLLCLAQVASDAGKGAIFEGTLTKKASSEEYGIKPVYIREAIQAARGLDSVVVTDTTDGYGQSVVIFDVKGYGQVSFHVFEEMPATKGQRSWDGQYGGSRRTVRKLIKKLRLPIQY